MGRRDRPHAFGVFKPVGHVVLAFGPGAPVERAIDALHEAGFGSADVMHYTPAQMVTQVDNDIAHASPLSSLGQDTIASSAPVRSWIATAVDRAWSMVDRLQIPARS